MGETKGERSIKKHFLVQAIESDRINSRTLQIFLEFSLFGCKCVKTEFHIHEFPSELILTKITGNWSKTTSFPKITIFVRLYKKEHVPCIYVIHLLINNRILQCNCVTHNKIMSPSSMLSKHFWKVCDVKLSYAENEVPVKHVAGRRNYACCRYCSLPTGAWHAVTHSPKYRIHQVSHAEHISQFIFYFLFPKYTVKLVQVKSSGEKNVKFIPQCLKS